MHYENLHAIRRTIQTTAIVIATEIKDVEGTYNERLNRLHDLREATLDLECNIVEDLNDAGYTSDNTIVKDAHVELRGAQDFINGVIACDVALALKED